MQEYSSELFRSSLKNNNIVAFDVGAKNGIFKLGKLEQHIKFYGFEPNEIEFQRLKKRGNVEYFPFALGETNGIRDLYLTNHSSFSSFLKLDEFNFKKHFGLMKDFPKWKEDMSVKEIIPVKVKSLDSIFKEIAIPHIDFLKLDTQGTELEILRGGKNLLSGNKISMIYAEFSFIKSYKNQNSFSEMEIYLNQFGYECIDCRFYPDYIESQYSKLTDKNIYDKARFSVGGDAIFIIDIEKQKMDRMSLFKLGLLASQLGYLSIASYMFKRCNMKDYEILSLLKEFNGREFSGKQILRNSCPPYLYRLLKNIRK